ncbi:transporter substrate-binding domain-containing protein [Marispirochaeta aestuarii]|uniref:substrate-binding periplasmic protein n=1 Tax=Marispirochaeta aestuarii TaxID=1963862 RepID=UPI002ABE0D11|nr:transporter substrate-binding domain-containing protein [Marispirochaeta aestuarii]
MRGRLFRLAIILCLLILCPGMAISQAVHYVFQEYRPANFLDETGQPAGFFVDIIREAVENRLGLDLRISVFPWVRCQALVRQGEADLMTTIPTPGRLEYADLVNVPIWIKQYRLYTYRDHPRVPEMHGIRSLEEIRKARFTVISYIGNNWAKTNLEDIGVPVLDATSVEGMYRMLIARRGDIIVDDPILVRDSLNAAGLENRIVLTEGLVESSTFYPMISKQSDLSARTEEFADALQAMWEDGSIESIMDRYQ